MEDQLSIRRRCPDCRSTNIDVDVDGGGFDCRDCNAGGHIDDTEADEWEEV